MTEKSPKTFIEPLLQICIDGSKSMADDFPRWCRPVARVLMFTFLLMSSVVIAPIYIVVRFVKKTTIDPFFKLRTELETKWYAGKQDEALKELREIKDTLDKNDMKLFFGGVSLPPYGKFKHDHLSKILWLLYHWEFHAGNFNEASQVCDSVLEQWSPKDPGEKIVGKYWEQWVVNKAKAIYKQKGETTAQEFLLKFIDPKNEESLINEYLYELRGKNKKIV